MYFKDKRVSLAVVIMLISSYAFICMTKSCFSSAMVYIVDEGYMTKFQTGTIVSAFWVVYALMQIVGGVFSDRFEPKTLITVGLIGAGAANLGVYFLYNNYALTIIIWSLNAALQFAVWPATFKIISTMLAPEHRSGGMVIATLAYPAGILASYLVAALIDRWQYNFLISAIGLFIFAAVWEVSMKYFKVFLVEKKKKDTSVVVRDADNNVVKPDESLSLKKLILMSGLVFIFIIGVFRSTINQVQTLVPIMIKESYSDVAPNFATILSLIVLFSSAIGPIIGSKLKNKVKNEVKLSAILLGAMIPMSVITLFIGKVNYMLVIFAVAVIVLLSSATSFLLITLIATRFNKWGRGATIAGFLNCFSALGTVGANFVLTLIAEELGWLATLIAVGILITVSVILAVIVTPIWGNFMKKNNITGEK